LQIEDKKKRKRKEEKKQRLVDVADVNRERYRKITEVQKFEYMSE